MASRLWARVCRWPDGPVGGLKGRVWVGVDEYGAFAGAPRGPVGIGEAPAGVDDDWDSPDICLTGVWLQPPRPGRDAYAPLAGGT